MVGRIVNIRAEKTWSLLADCLQQLCLLHYTRIDIPTRARRDGTASVPEDLCPRRGGDGTICKPLHAGTSEPNAALFWPRQPICSQRRAASKRPPAPQGSHRSNQRLFTHVGTELLCTGGDISSAPQEHVPSWMPAGLARLVTALIGAPCNCRRPSFFLGLVSPAEL